MYNTQISCKGSANREKTQVYLTKVSSFALRHGLSTLTYTLSLVSVAVFRGASCLLLAKKQAKGSANRQKWGQLIPEDLFIGYYRACYKDLSHLPQKIIASATAWGRTAAPKKGKRGCVKTQLCHPEHSEGSLTGTDNEILRVAQNDTD